MATQEQQPFAKYEGQLALGDHHVDCYVLNTEQRVVTQSSTIRALTDSANGDLVSYLRVQGLRDYISPSAVLEGAVEFRIPGTQFPGRGIQADTFLDICRAYVRALGDGALTTDRQVAIATKASILLAACAKVGLDALIDEATGYQYDRDRDALQVKLRAYIADELREWERTFPDELWEEFGRLTNWQGPLHSRPKYWGLLVLDLIYEALDPDVAEHLKATKPRPVHRQNYHQWMTEDYGLPKLLRHINQVIGMAKTCSTMDELRHQVALHYKKNPLQLRFPAA